MRGHAPGWATTLRTSSLEPEGPDAATVDARFDPCGTHRLGSSSGLDDRHPARAGRADRDVRPGGGELELLGDHACGVVLAQAGQTLVVAVQAPDVARVLAGAAEGGVESEVGGVDGLGELD